MMMMMMLMIAEFHWYHDMPTVTALTF